jgi:hypothetical protein
MDFPMDFPMGWPWQEAPGLGTIWLNPAVQTHHLWYAHGPEQHQQHHVLVQGSSMDVGKRKNGESRSMSKPKVRKVAWFLHVFTSTWVLVFAS